MARWLLEHLAELGELGEAAKPAGVVTAGADAGFSRSTLYRARRVLGGAVKDAGSGPRDPHKRWLMAAPVAYDNDIRAQ